MATNNLGRNVTLEIYTENGGSFHDLYLRKSTWDSVVMSLGDKITGDVYYPSNDLVVTMKEYVVYNGVHYTLVNPPVIVREGMLKDNAELSGMTKYSFTFYHPMYMLGNFPFTDVAVTSAQEKYLSQNKTFSWIGNLVDFVAKLNKNLQGTEWCVEVGDTVPQQERTKLSDVMTFDKQTIADALKKGYEKWEVPYIIDSIANTDARYASGKRFLVRFGLPSQEILVENTQHEQVPFVFQFGQGVGLKNNSRTPRNNKIVTRIAGYGSETNVPYGYPQIPWTGNQSWNYTINNDPSATNSYPIYDGIMNGQPVRLIKHPFTRTTLMPSIYSNTVNKKVNPNATGYDPTTEIKDYYDADSTYDNPIDLKSPSYEIHEFDKIKPELGDTSIVGVGAYDGKWDNAITILKCLEYIDDFYSESENEAEKAQLKIVRSLIPLSPTGSDAASSDDYTYDWSVEKDANYTTVKYTSSGVNFEYIVRRSLQEPQPEWDDTMDGDGNYAQSYFKITLPQLSFDIYACAAVTQEMNINMRSGACIGCSFQVAVDWEDYKLNFYDANGNFAPSGSQRDYDKYPNSANGQIKVVVKKDNNTFGTLMPNIYQQPASGDKFVILGISLPYTYVTSAEERLDDDMKQYMRDNNVYYYDYPLKFDEHFLATHTDVLAQMKPNVIVRFDYAGTTLALYIKQMTIKYGQSPLPQYDITLTDDVEIVLNQIGKVTDDVSNLRVLMGEGNGNINLSMLDKRYLSKISDDRASGMITFIRGLQIGSQFVSGLLGEGGIFRRDADGTTYLETDKLYVRMRAYFDTVEVRRYIHSGGNRIASKAGIKCTRVEYIDADGNVIDDATNAVKFRCYFRANDNGVTITNDFEVNDLAFCRETNVDTSSVDQHSYWRKVIGVGNTVSDAGELYIDLSASDCQSGSDIPIAQDDIIQLGNTSDTTRQGAIIEYVGGDDAPAYQIYQSINSYSLNNKNYVRFGYDSQSGGAQAFIGNPDQSTYLWYHLVTEGGQTFPRLDIKANVKFMSPTTHQETTIEAFASAVETSIEDLQSQIDGEIDTWFYEGTPTLDNAPASGWTTDAEKERHLGDLYYDIGSGQTGGFAYRFIKTESGGTTTYSWQYIDDTAITEALAKSAAAYDLADHKRRVFLATPTPPYDNGDLWVNAVWPASGASQGSTYNDDILRCLTSKTADQQFAIADWTLASKYTDDSALTDFVTNTYAGDLANINTQIDKKAETWYQDTDPSTAWTTDDLKLAHVGDIWCDTSTDGGKKTWIFRDRGEGQTNRFYWAQQSVPDVVFDTIDGKAAVYTSWNAWGNDLNEKDLFIPATDTTQGGVTYKANKVYRCTNASTPTFEEIHYTDDAALTNFLNNTYANDKQNLQSQIDGKAETWRQDTDPASSWTSTETKASHVGDLWMDTSSNGGNKTYIYQNTGTSANPVYRWVAQAVPDDVFDEIDGKAAIFVTQPSNYHANDLWILAAETTVNGVTYKQGEVLTATQDSETYNQAHWTKKVCYTDDAALNTFINGAYSDFVNDIQTQVDEKAETWVSSSDPAAQWTTAELKAEHVGDMWLNTSNGTLSGVGTMKTAVYTKSGSTYSWVVDNNIPNSVFDTIDGKKTVYVTWSSITTAMSKGVLQVRDLYIPSSTTTQNGVTYTKNKVYRCTNVGAYSGGAITTYPTFAEIAYTDDTKLDAFLNGYTGTLTGITNSITTAQTTADNAATAASNAQTSADNAAALAAAADYLRQALGQDTTIVGGLVLTTTIGLRDSSNNVWSGINGAYQTAETGTGYKGHGIAAWYGGGMVDGEVTPSATNQAKSLFRFDGSGYVASKNISWDKNGNVTIQGYSINATTLQVGGSAVATQAALASYLPLSAGSDKKLTGTLYSQSILPKTDNTYNLGGSSNYWKYLYVKRIYLAADVYLEYDSTNTAIKLNGSFYATGGVTALGAGSGGSGGGGGDVTWALLASNSDTHAIAWSHISAALASSGYATQTWVTQQISGSTGSYLPLSGGTMTGSIIGSNGAHLRIKMMRDTSNALDGLVWIDTAGTRIGNIQYHNTVQRIILNAIGAENIYSDSEGKYSFIIGNNELKYNTYAIWHSGNDGTGSGLDADLLDGQHGSYYATASSITTLQGYFTSGIANRAKKLAQSSSGVTSLASFTDSTDLIYMAAGGGNTIEDKPSGVDAFGVLSFKTAAGYYGQILMSVGGYTYTRSSNSLSGGWGQLAKTTDNVASATKLQTSRTLWGQSFDGTSNVSGNISSTGNITPSETVSKNIGSSTLMYEYGYIRRLNTQSNYDLRIGAGGEQYIQISSSTGTVSISSAVSISSTLSVTGASTLTGLLTANGGITIPSGKTLKIGDAELSWDSTNQGIKVTKGLYSQTFVSALGVGSSGSSGTGDVTWALLASSSDTRQIALSHLTGALTTYATQSWVNSQIAGISTSLSGLSDVNVSGVSSGQYLKFNGQGWVADTPSSGTTSTRNLVIGGTSYTVTSPYTTNVDVDSVYLKLTGGTITGGFGALIIKRNTNDYSAIKYVGSTGTLLGYIGVGENNRPIFTADGSAIYTLLHKNNFVSTLASGTSDVVEGTEFITSYAGADGFSTSGYTTTYYRRPVSKLWAYINSKVSVLYLPLSGGVLTGSVYHKSSTLERGVLPSSRTVMARGWRDKNDKNLGWFEFVSETDGTNSIGLYVLTNTNSSVSDEYSGLRIFKKRGVEGSYSATYNANTGVLEARTLKSTIATGTAPLTIASTTVVTNLNADLLDGTHKSELFTGLSNGTYAISVTIGGTNKTLTVGYATEAARFRSAQILSENTSGDANTMQLDGEGTVYSVLTNYHNNSKWQNMPSLSGYYGGVVEIKGLDTSLKMQLAWCAEHNNTTAPTKKLWFRARANKGYVSTDWHEVAMTDSNVASATKLQTSRTLWGQSFDGTSNVSGNMTDVGSITASGDVYMANAKYIRAKDTNGTNQNILGLNAENNLLIGYGIAGAGYVTVLYGSTVYIRYGTSRTTGITLGSNGTTTFSGNVVPSSGGTYNLGSSSAYFEKTYTRYIDTASGYNLRLCVGGSEKLSIAASSGNVGIGNTSPSYKLDVYGASRSKYMLFYNNEYSDNSGYVGGGSSSSNEIILEAYSGNALSLWSNGARTMYLDTSNRVGIGNTSPSYKLHVTGDVYATGGVTCLSDERKKDVIGELPISVNDIAGAPAIRFLWKDNRIAGNQAGSIAQYWQKVLPEVITDKSGELSMQYGVAALVSSIIVARKVVNHEERIRQLEKENERLRTEIEQLKAA